MQTSEHYRAKAAEMLRLAEAAAGPHMRTHWTAMATQWTALAHRVDAEDRMTRDFLSEARV